MSLDSNRASTDAQSASNQTISPRQKEATPYAIEEESHTDIPITVTPASPLGPSFATSPTNNDESFGDHLHRLSVGRHRIDGSTGRKVSRILKSKVHRGQERISSISKIIGHKTSHDGLRRTSSAPGECRILMLLTTKKSQYRS
jgi:hypothetical protein